MTSRRNPWSVTAPVRTHGHRRRARLDRRARQRHRPLPRQGHRLGLRGKQRGPDRHARSASRHPGVGRAGPRSEQTPGGLGSSRRIPTFDVNDRALMLSDDGARWIAILETLRNEGFSKIHCGPGDGRGPPPHRWPTPSELSTANVGTGTVRSTPVTWCWSAIPGTAHTRRNSSRRARTERASQRRLRKRPGERSGR